MLWEREEGGGGGGGAHLGLTLGRFHNAEQRKEGAEINASLYALKECVRLRRLQVVASAPSRVVLSRLHHSHLPWSCHELHRVSPPSRRLCSVAHAKRRSIFR